MKPKVIIFGIGTSFKSFLQNFNNEYEIIGLSDWDESKHGLTMGGYKIINPYKFEEHDYDYILIVSYYVREIQNQLKERINLGDDKIMVPPKYMIKHGKPFEDPKTKAFAGELIIGLTKMCDKAGITLYLDYGSLLGIVRDKNVIEWDDDIDFSINQQDAKTFNRLLLENKDNLPYSEFINWSAICLQDDEGNLWNFSLMFQNRDKQLFNEFDIGIGVNKFYENSAVSMRMRYFSRPLIHFKNFDIIAYQGYDLKAPYRHIEYLNYLYHDWVRPKVYSFGQKYGSGERVHMPELKTNNSEKILF